MWAGWWGRITARLPTLAAQGRLPPRRNASFNVGGLVGVNTGTITTSYSSAAVNTVSAGVTIVGGLVGQDVGGLVGENSGGTIANSYSIGTVTGNSEKMSL